MATENATDDLAEIKQVIDDIKAGVRRPDGRRLQRALDEARWRFIPTTGITKQVPRTDLYDCAVCSGATVYPESVERAGEACDACEGKGKVPHTRLVPFVVRSPLTVKRANVARAFAHETCEAFAKYAEPRALRVDAYARGHRNVQMRAA